MPPTARPDHLTAVLDLTPGRHPTDSPEIGWWLPVIGPTATVLAATLVANARGGATRWDTTDLAGRIGLAGNLSKLWYSLERLASFRCATFASTDVFVIRCELPELTARQQNNLPPTLRDRYDTCASTRSSVFTDRCSTPTHSPTSVAVDAHLDADYEDRHDAEAYS
jgi:hypothetical protein